MIDGVGAPSRTGTRPRSANEGDGLLSVDSYKLSERVAVDAAQDLLSQTSAIAEGGSFSLDASGVEAIDGSAVLAIANIARTFAARGAPIKLVSPSKSFIDGFNDLGLYGDLMKMEFHS